MMTRVRQGQSAENEKTVKIPMESDHNNNNDQHFLSICHISGTVLNPLSDLLTESLWQILRDVLFLLASSYIYIYIHIHIYIHTHTHTHTYIYIYMWRRQWHPTLVLLPGKSHGQRSLAGCSPRGRKESDTTGRLHFHFSLSCLEEGNGNPLQCVLPGELQGWRSLVGCRLWGRMESDTTTLSTKELH